MASYDLIQRLPAPVVQIRGLSLGDFDEISTLTFAWFRDHPSTHRGRVIFDLRNCDRVTGALLGRMMQLALTGAEHNAKMELILSGVDRRKISAVRNTLPARLWSVFPDLASAVLYVDRSGDSWEATMSKEHGMRPILRLPDMAHLRRDAASFYGPTASLLLGAGTRDLIIDMRTLEMITKDVIDLHDLLLSKDRVAPGTVAAVIKPETNEHKDSREALAKLIGVFTSIAEADAYLDDQTRTEQENPTPRWRRLLSFRR